ncbi:MAG: PrgI family protein [bacterium]
MRYQTPQFIEEETKLFGPLTFKQFVYLIGGAGISFAVYKMLPFLLAILIIAPVAGASLALAFYKINERPFIDAVEAAFYFIISNRLYTYQKIDKPTQQLRTSQKTMIAPVPKIGASTSRLKDLAWSLDINENIKDKSKDNFDMGVNDKIKI